MDSKEPIHCGKISTVRAAMGKDGRLRRPVCVDTAVLPSGKSTVTGLEVGSTSKMTWVSLREIKLPVDPVSAFAKVGEERFFDSFLVSLCLKTLATGEALSHSSPPPAWVAAPAAPIRRLLFRWRELFRD